MKELLEKVLSEVLNEEARTELADTIQTAMNEAVDTEVNRQVAEKTDALVVEYATQFAADREALIEALDTKVEEMLKEQLEELRDDIEKFRDLEVEKAAELVTERAKLAEAVQQDMTTLVERLDTFLEMRLTEEVEELKESIAEVRKINLGRKIFEAFQSEVEQFTAADNGVEELTAQLEEARKELATRDEALAEAAKETARLERKTKLDETLASLQGHPREIMEAILKTVPTDKLEESYQKFIGRVLHESVDSSEKESTTPVEPVLAEGEQAPVAEPVQEPVVLVTGDSEGVKPEEKPAPAQLSEGALHLQRLAGINH
ncbi:hypothetical protein Xoosp13_258 [Xanthomonas phage Xoo-sp13]|nr:hypothetical protein Xoosp13_258 [Xanthomonas phage Xoo-sp13]